MFSTQACYPQLTASSMGGGAVRTNWKGCVSWVLRSGVHVACEKWGSGSRDGMQPVQVALRQNASSEPCSLLDGTALCVFLCHWAGALMRQLPAVVRTSPGVPTAWHTP